MPRTQAIEISISPYCIALAMITSASNGTCRIPKTQRVPVESNSARAKHHRSTPISNAKHQPSPGAKNDQGCGAAPNPQFPVDAVSRDQRVARPLQAELIARHLRATYVRTIDQGDGSFGLGHHQGEQEM